MKYKIYVKIDENNYIIEVNSSAFISDLTGWIEIDSGYGDKYHHAQGNYFSEPIMIGFNIYRYKLIDGKVVECTDDDIAEQKANIKYETPVTIDDRVAVLEEENTLIKEENAMLLECILELSEVIYA